MINKLPSTRKTAPIPWFILLAVGLTFVSLGYKHNADCTGMCAESLCETTACQRVTGVGFPLPMIIDQGGGSPLSGIGKIGEEDFFPALFLFLALINVAIYVILLNVGWSFIMYLQRRSK